MSSKRFFLLIMPLEKISLNHSAGNPAPAESSRLLKVKTCQQLEVDFLFKSHFRRAFRGKAAQDSDAVREAQ